MDRLWRQLSPNRTAEYSDSNHNVHALSGDVNGGAATVGTMSSPLTPLVTDIQWPPWLKMGPAPQKRNGQSTLGLPMHMGGVRQAARCPYGAAEPSWAMVRCYSSSHPPILYTACVGLSYIFQKVTLKEKNHPPGSALEPISQAAPPSPTPMATIIPRPSREM